MTPTVFLVAVALVSCVLSQNGHEDCDRGAGRAGNDGNNNSGITSIDPNGPPWDPITNGPIDITTMNTGRQVTAEPGRCIPRRCQKTCQRVGRDGGYCIINQCRCYGCNLRRCMNYCRLEGHTYGRCERRNCKCYGRVG